MRIDSHNESHLTCTLSVRNLEALLSKAKRPDSLRTLEKFEDGFLLQVKVEPNDEHYSTRGYPPGEVHYKDDPGVS